MISRLKQRNAYFVINLNIWTVQRKQDMTAQAPFTIILDAFLNQNEREWKLYKGMKSEAELRLVSYVGYIVGSGTSILHL